jgi:uncharacterized lipoprotein YddW (UPF0748 family)
VGKPFFSRRRMVLGFVLLLAIALVSHFLHQAPIYPQKTSSNKETRGVWMTHIGTALLYFTATQDEAVYQLASLHFNRIYPAVWDSGYTLYPSAVAKKVTGASSWPIVGWSHRDVFDSLITQAHRQGLSVVPWFEYGLMVPANSELVRRHPDWLSRDRHGKSRQKDQFEDMAWLNPLHPQVQQFLVDLVAEAVNKYSVEGIQFDDHFALPIGLGYDPCTVALYRKEHSGSMPPSNPYNQEWMRWRANKLTVLMTKIHRAVKQECPHCLVSLSPNVAEYAYNTSLQDWPDWVQRGIVDEVVVQIYRPRSAQMPAFLENRSLKQARRKVPVSVGIYTGPFFGAKSLPEVKKQVEVVRSFGYSGVSFFCWETTLWLFKPDSENKTEKMYSTLFP